MQERTFDTPEAGFKSACFSKGFKKVEEQIATNFKPEIRGAAFLSSLYLTFDVDYQFYDTSMSSKETKGVSYLGYEAFNVK